MDYSTTVQLGLLGTAGPFALYSVILQLDISSFQVFASSIDIENGGDEEAMFFKIYSILQFF